MKRVPLIRAIAEFLEDTEFDSKNRMRLQREALYAERKIGGYYSVTPRVTLDRVNENSVSYPEDALMIYDILPGDQRDENLIFNSTDNFAINYSPTIYSDIPEVDGHYWSSLFNHFPDNIQFETDGMNINLYPGYDNRDVTIRYCSFQKDQQGRILVNESHIEAIATYLKYKEAEREKWKVFKSGRMIRNGHMAMARELKMEWRVKLRQAKELDFNENIDGEIKNINSNRIFPLNQ